MCSSPPSEVPHKMHVFSLGKNSSDHVLLDSFSCGARMLAFFCAIFCITIFSSSSLGCSGMASVWLHNKEAVDWAMVSTLSAQQIYNKRGMHVKWFYTCIGIHVYAKCVGIYLILVLSTHYWRVSSNLESCIQCCYFLWSFVCLVNLISNNSQWSYTFQHVCACYACQYKRTALKHRTVGYIRCLESITSYMT